MKHLCDISHMKSRPAFDRVLLSYETRMAEEQSIASRLSGTEAFARRDEFLLSVGEDVAALLRDLIIGLRPKILVELGTSYGYSTMFLAAAAQQVGGKVFTYEIAPEKQAFARAQIAAAELSEVVEWRLGDALGLLADQRGPVDFVLMDL